MIHPPAYFEQIRLKAARRWEQLEQDPELAGPWHQLFKQVQSPRHVVSELLQNADDALATEASVEIKGEEFEFRHNGHDFTDEHFASLCRFGYSNKRALHTIGFRGIGFKSTFSLGDQVRLESPTLSIAFYRHRFTEPVWLQKKTPLPVQTEVLVTIKDEHRRLELEKNLTEWLKSPASLLFFRSIRCLRIGEQEVRWNSNGPGPIEHSEWMVLSTDPEKRYLLLRTPPEEFPAEAMEEIMQERMVSVDDETVFPPCRVEIVLGMEGRLYVILPTGVKLNLPFACNAPFVQDPARVKIKDPETSLTNRWLLKRAGDLAAKAMLAWLAREEISIESRCKAYDLMPDVDREDNSIEGSCATIAEEAFENTLSRERYLLGEDGRLHEKMGCMAVPATILDVWTTVQVASAFSDARRPVLCRYISEDNLSKLLNWDVVEKKDKDGLLAILKAKHLPKPETWRQLMILWAYIADEVSSGSYYYRPHKDIRVFPVQGKKTLFSAKEVIRLSEKKLLSSQDDWEFLSEYLLVLNQNWLRFLTKQRLVANERQDDELGEQAESAHSVLKALELDNSSDVSRIIEQVALKYFAREECPLADCIRIAQLAVTFGATVPGSFEFVTHDGYRRSVAHGILADLRGDIDRFVYDEWFNEHVLHPDYWKVFRSCSKTEWYQWISSGRSKLFTFVPLVQAENRVWGRPEIKRILRLRGLTKDLQFPYVTNNFVIDDWDFLEEQWQYWKNLADEDPDLWGRVLSIILEQPSGYWAKAISISRVCQVSQQSTTRTITSEKLLPAWIVKFRDLPCLQDTRGHFRQPAELLRRTPETESLLDVEPFLRAEYDTEQTRPLLILLGVRDTPTGPDRLLDRLRALATVQTPPVYEVEKWYHRLDQMLARCSTEEFDRIKSAFVEGSIVLTENSGWAKLSEVFISAEEEDAPGVAILHPSVRHLMLWQKIGMENRPTADLALNWLQNLPPGQKLSQDQSRRVRSLLPRYADRIWDECGHWLNLEGEWVPIERLAFKLTMQTLIPWSNLFQPIKQKTADCQRLSTETCQLHPFSSLPSLAESIEDRFVDDINELSQPESKKWICSLGEGLRRIILDEEGECKRIRDIASRLAETKWQIATELKTIPYIDGTPAGTPRSIDVLWKDSVLYVQNKSMAQMARVVSQELGRVFGRPDIADTLKICFDRSESFIKEYLEENFRLLPPEEVQPTKEKAMEPPPMTESQTTGDEENIEAVDTVSGLEDVDQQADKTESSTEVSAYMEEDPLSEDQGDEDADQTSPKKHPSKPSKPKLIEIFAKEAGFLKDGPDRFYHTDGSWIQRANGASFPWDRYSAAGELVQCYWVKEHCIQQGPLQIDADVWELCDKNPDKYTLILTNVEGVPVEFSGQKLRQLRDNGLLALFPAKYRLVYEHEKSNG